MKPQITNHKTQIATLFLFFSLFLASTASATLLVRGMPLGLTKENHPEFIELYRIKIENQVGGTVEVSEDRGQSWQPVGKVLYPTHKVNKNGYQAAKWIGEGQVAATAVNAIHIKTGGADWEKSIFSILPKEFLKPPKHYQSFLSPDSSIYTDIPAGKSIFGGGFAPFVGNQVMVSSAAQPVVVMPRDYEPKIGDTYYIIVERPVDYPKEIIFENRFGGRIYLNYYGGDQRVIGEVLFPVSGIGRFAGSKYVTAGRIRANHPGVIDISVSPYGSIGGFQIIPALHTLDMRYVKSSTQWMVIGPTDVEDPSLEGIAPFFKYFIQPNYRPDDLYAKDWEARFLDRFLVEVIYEGDSTWEPMPVFEIDEFYLSGKLPAWADKALDKVSHVRIFFPIN
ncbi:MAG: hypothetical protein HQ596_01440 [Candidatus Saganbacteria bacterium]|nr:hypothetical protein [Candidatus Saganbacteria bacterium]